MPGACAYCGDTFNLQRCSICKVALYCSRDHQKKHWTSHQKQCKRPATSLNTNLDFNSESAAQKNQSQFKQFEQDQPRFRQNETQFEQVQPRIQCVQPQFEPNQPRFTQEQPQFGESEPRYNDNYDDISAPNSDDQLDLPEDFYAKLLNCSAAPGTEFENDLSVLNSLSKALGIYPTTEPDPRPEYEETEPGNSVPPFLLHRSVTADRSEAMKLRCQYLIDDLDRYGICVMDDFLGSEWARAILNDVQSLYQEGNFKNGKVVKNLCGKPSAVIRGDKTLEVMGNENAAGNIKKFMQVVDEVVIRSCKFPNNRKIGTYDIRHRTKAMVAVYPGNDSKYVKHVDNPHKDGRCITSIYYLNENWNSKEDGGLLRIFPTEWNGNVADIEPLFDRMVFFWSDRRNPHEVQPSKKIRYAITLWYYDYSERTAFERQQMQLNCSGSGASSGFDAGF